MLTSIMERDQIVFYEVPDSLKKSNSENILMPCVFREENSRQNFGYPIYLSLPRHNCKGKDIQQALQVNKIQYPTFHAFYYPFIFIL
jgi:hypothetical protein